MTHYKELLDTSFIGQWDFKRGTDGKRCRYKLEIANVERYKPARPRTKKCPNGPCVSCKNTGRIIDPNKRLLITFRNARKPWLAGPVSQEVICGMFGHDIENWRGKTITLYVDEEVRMGRVKTGGVRCAPVPGQGQAEQMPDEPVDEDLAQQIADAFDDAGVST